MRPIGVIRNSQAGAPVPIRARFDPDGRGEVHLLPEMAPALDGLEGFDFVWLFTELHEVDDPRERDGDSLERLRPVPLLLAESGRRVGAFASRHPARPNRIGMSLVRLLSIEGLCLRFAGLDLFDGTPVLDIKPWVARIDLPVPTAELHTVRSGWYDDLASPRPTATHDLAAVALATLAARTPAVVARSIELRGFGPERPGEICIISGDPGDGPVAEGDATDIAGHILNGTMDVPLRAAAAELLRSSLDAVTTGCTVDGIRAVPAGLTCGGTAEILLQRLETLPQMYWLDDTGVARATVTRLDGDHAGASLTYTQLGDDEGSLGDEDADASARRLASWHMLWGAAGAVRVDDPLGRLLVDVVWSMPRLLAVGTGPLADALTRVASGLEWSARSVADADEAIAYLGVATPADAVVVLSHDATIDAPVLMAALGSDARYVGAVGSRRTQIARRERLAAAGATPEMLARLHGPAGLDLGAAGPAEIALSVIAEIVSVRAGRNGQSLSETQGPIRGRPALR
jgi:xanthine dehydrogenase accessory factor